MKKKIVIKKSNVKGPLKKATYGGKMAGLKGEGTLAPKSGDTGHRPSKLHK